jgi:hypothetical protein
MDKDGEPTHISPIFFDLLERQFLPRAGLKLRDHLVFPPNGYQLTRKSLAWMLRIASMAFSSESISCDNHLLVIQAAH